jgi:transposase
MQRFTPDLKHHILTQYQPYSREHGFTALAQLYGITGGKQTVQKWHRQWNGTAASLQRKPGSGRPRLLSKTQINNCILTPIRNRRRAHKAAHYTELLPSVQHKTGRSISIRTLRRYGKQAAGLKHKHSKKRTLEESKPTHIRTTACVVDTPAQSLMKVVFVGCVGRPVSVGLCNSIATLRKKIQRISKERVLFLDETALRLNEAPTCTLAFPGDDAYVIADDTSSYAARYDMIACCNDSSVFPPMIFTPTERADAGVKGINKKMLVKYIQTILAQAIGALDQYPIILVLDRASIHKRDLLQEFHDMGCQDVQDIWFMPKQAAKRMSPLDNALFHDWKERCRKREPIRKNNIEQIMADEWNNLPTQLTHAHYQHCLLTHPHDPYADCPDPAAHSHTT